LYTQVGLDQRAAYEHALDVMTRSSQTPDAQEGFAAFLEKRRPRFE
jgi:enoyl-CoA hydratase/carnithine racemase